MHETMAAAAHDHVKLADLTAELDDMLARKESLEEAWLTAAEE
jgi:hypothetical protein